MQKPLSQSGKYPSFNEDYFNVQPVAANVQMSQMNANKEQVYYSNQLASPDQKREYINEGEHAKKQDGDSIDQTRKIKLFTQYKGYIGNEIQSSKYYAMPLFIFQNIWFQMHKLANIYFVIIALLQCIPAISISQGQPVILLPLIVVISVSLLKDYFEDRKRKLADNEENNRRVCVLTSSEQQRKEIPCKDLKVGHIILVQQLHYFVQNNISQNFLK